MASNRRQKDQEMAQRLKSDGVERRTGRCALCYQMIPNGLFYPQAWDNHLLRCPGPAKKHMQIGKKAA